MLIGVIDDCYRLICWATILHSFPPNSLRYSTVDLQKLLNVECVEALRRPEAVLEFALASASGGRAGYADALRAASEAVHAEAVAVAGRVLGSHRLSCERIRDGLRDKLTLLQQELSA